MWQQLNNTCTLRNPADHPEEWFYITRFHKKYWKTLVHRATMLDILKNSDNCSDRYTSMSSTICNRLENSTVLRHDRKSRRPKACMDALRAARNVAHWREKQHTCFAVMGKLQNFDDSVTPHRVQHACGSTTLSTAYMRIYDMDGDAKHN